MKHHLLLPLLFALLALAPLAQAADAPTARELGYDIAETGLDGRTFVVSPDGDDDNPGTEERPMRTPQAAADRVEPGDTVLLRAGEYTNQGAAPVLEIQRGGDRRNWVRFASYPGETATIRFDGLRGVRVGAASHVVIEGLEVVGVAEQIDPAEALAHATAFKGSDFSQHRFFGVGVRLGDEPGETPHHVIIRGNTIHHTPGGGVSIARSDYVLVEGNHIYKTSFYSPWGESGVSMWRSVDSDNERRAYKMVVKDNLIHQNDNLVPFWVMEQYTDGNGIILDANEATPGPGSEDHKSYRGRFLVVNNVCFGNGGRGVNVFETRNADVRHNTLANNATRGNIGSEVELGRTDRVQIRNNVIVPGAGKKAVGGYSTQRQDIDANLVHGGTQSDFPLGGDAATGAPGLPAGADARPDGPVVELSLEDFRPAPGSAAAGVGDPRASFPVDALGAPRGGEPLTAGALQPGGA